MDIAFGSEQGIRQSLNGDACVSTILPWNAVFLGVADGFSAEGQGHRAALHALELVCAYLRDHPGNRAPSEESLRSLLLAAFDHANMRLYEAGGGTDDFVGGGASVTAMLIVGRRAFVGHIGDARAYLLRFARLEALTADDVVFTDARGVAGGLKSGASSQPHGRGLLWRSLGTQVKLEAGVARVDLLAGDQVILCTDGIHGCVSAEEICGVMLESERSCDAVARLLAMMKMRGGIDNGTIVAARDLTAVETLAPIRRKKKMPFGTYLLLAGASLLLAFILLFIAAYA